MTNKGISPGWRLYGDIDKFEKFLKSSPNIHQISPNVVLFRQTSSVVTLLSQYGGNDVSCSFFTLISSFYHNAVQTGLQLLNIYTYKSRLPLCGVNNVF